MKSARNKTAPFLLVLSICFAIGLMLGIWAYYTIPEDIVLKARNTFEFFSGDANAFDKIYMKNIATELGWIITVWCLGYMNITAALMSAVIAIRGFLIGFSVIFIMAAKRNVMLMMLSSILPQAVVALPVMTFFAALCTRLSLERRKTGKWDSQYIITGGVYAVITFLSALVETFISIIFINIG